MVKRALAAAVLLAALVTAFVTSAAGDVNDRQTLRLIDVGASIDVFLSGGNTSHTGDREVFRDTLVWAKDHTPAGRAEGQCTVIDASTATTTCTIVTTLHRGTLTTEGVGVFVPGRTSTAAITGGIGAYESATGHGTFTFNPGGESAVTFTLQR
jgi:hypothetical protein